MQSLHHRCYKRRTKWKNLSRYLPTTIAFNLSILPHDTLPSRLSSHHPTDSLGLPLVHRRPLSEFAASKSKGANSSPILDALLNLDHAGLGRVAAARPRFRICDIANARWNLFGGPLPECRSDDPGMGGISKPEPRRPGSFRKDIWDACRRLQPLITHHYKGLHVCVRHILNLYLSAENKKRPPRELEPFDVVKFPDSVNTIINGPSPCYGNPGDKAYDRSTVAGNKWDDAWVTLIIELIRALTSFRPLKLTTANMRKIARDYISNIGFPGSVESHTVKAIAAVLSARTAGGTSSLVPGASDPRIHPCYLSDWEAKLKHNNVDPEFYLKQTTS